MDVGIQEQDTASFDSYVSRENQPGAMTEEDYFNVLSLRGSVQRTAALCGRHGPRLVRWTTTTMLPFFLVAALTAMLRTDPYDTTTTTNSSSSSSSSSSNHLHKGGGSSSSSSSVPNGLTLTPFDELTDALPLVVWHLGIWMLGTLLTVSVVIRYIAETVYAGHAIHTPYRASIRAIVTTSSRVGLLLAAGVFMLGSVALVYLLGHVLTVGLADLRHNASAVHHKNPLVFGFMEAASWIMTIAVDATAVFAVVWMACMYGHTVPIIILLESQQSQADPVEVFRQAYVLARDSRPYLVASWIMAALPAILVSGFVTYPLYLVTRRSDGQQDFVEWQLGTLAGIVALYLPMMTVWLPVLGIHQTVLYMTLRVLKDGLTLEVLKGDLDRTAPAYAMVQPTADAIPLTYGPTGSHDDDMIEENEFDHNGSSSNNKDIEMSAVGNSK